MPPLPAVTNVLRVRLVGTLGDLPDAGNRFYIAFSGSNPTVAELVTFCTAVGTAWNGNISPLVDATYTLTEVIAEDLTSSSAAVGNAAVSHIGTRSGAGVPGSTCLVVNYDISRRYRGGHPRGYYFAGVAGDLATDQEWSSAFIASAQTNFTNFFASIFAAGWSGAGTLQQVNVSFYESFTTVLNPVTGRTKNPPKVRTAVPTPDIVTAVTPRVRIGSQRRRLL